MEQLSIFDVLYEPYKIKKPIRLIELFAGYGSQALALKYLGKEFEHWKICEWATKSINAYRQIHFPNAKNECNLTKEELVEYLNNKGISADYNQPMKKEQIQRLQLDKLKEIYNDIQITNNLVNIQQAKGKDFEIVDQDKYEYIMIYSFPCQDLSKAGKMKGMEDTTTRSGMLWEVERILDELNETYSLPQVLLMENVPDVHGTLNSSSFIKWQLKLEQLGYKNYWQDLNAKNYGIPQNRDRCFMISVLGDYSYSFPGTIKLEKKLKDLLEDEVDEKYYLSDKMIDYISANNDKWTGNNGKALANKSIASTLKETLEKNEIQDGCYIDTYNKSVNENVAGTITTRVSASNNTYVGTYNWAKSDAFAHGKRFKENNETSETLLGTGNQAGVVVAIPIKNNTKEGFLLAEEGDGVDISSRIEHHRGTVQKGMVQTLTTQNERGVVANNLRIRKLTPKECFRLMGVKDEDFEKLEQSNASLYHLAGDSIVVNVLMAIFEKLF